MSLCLVLEQILSGGIGSEERSAARSRSELFPTGWLAVRQAVSAKSDGISDQFGDHLLRRIARAWTITPTATASVVGR
ncbi:unnamed protein product [Heligmosomoides polygyrus]|uniref:RUN domain-containing protein n=1 Tax=Heligmosomoides polygyrus TaxID=6339 RepID=A0A183FSW6_HELPZ|nr:unnamed protein product [Heligmosomoides polygyrus]